MPYTSSRSAPHESFPQPDDGNVPVWRYMDLPKLISMLAHGSLPLARADLLKDAFEGSITRAVADAWNRNPNVSAWFTSMRTTMRASTYVSCWHANHWESEAMWRLYCADGIGLALQTTYQRLDESLPAHLFLGAVKYINYEATDSVPADFNAFSPYMQKRLAFEHEREIRVVDWRLASLAQQKKLPHGEASIVIETPAVSWVEWDIAATVQHVYVSPYAPEWYRDVVESVLDKYCNPLKERLVWSAMKAVPLF